jgi:hypothetical protein
MREMSGEFSMRGPNRQVASLRNHKPKLNSGAASKLQTVSTPVADFL